MTEMVVFAVLAVLLSYLVGSLPFGFWIAKLFKGKNFDIRDWGSNNIGFTNVKRVLGWKAGIPVLIADISKGLLPVLIVKKLLGPTLGDWPAVLCLFAAVIGHAKSLYFKWTEGVFSGGKAVATSLGGIIALQPLLAVIAFAIFLLGLLGTGYLSIGSIIAAIATIPLSFLLKLGPTWNMACIGVALLILYTHRRNILRLIDGTETKFNAKRGAHETGDEAVVAFVIHSITTDDLSQTRISSWIHKLLTRRIIAEKTVRWLIAHGIVMEADQIKGIVTKTGKYARVLILGIPLLPDQIMDPENRNLVEALLKSATVQAQRMGATIIGLGALLSSAVSGGVDLQEWAKKKRFDNYS